MMDMLATEYDLSDNNCPDCGYIKEKADLTRYLKENTDLKEAFIEADYESVCRSMQYDDKLSYVYRQLQDSKNEIEQLKAENRSRSQRKEKGVKG